MPGLSQYKYPLMQWAAVRTWLGPTKAPPQTYTLSYWSFFNIATCHGYSPMKRKTNNDYTLTRDGFHFRWTELTEFSLSVNINRSFDSSSNSRRIATTTSSSSINSRILIGFLGTATNFLISTGLERATSELSSISLHINQIDLIRMVKGWFIFTVDGPLLCFSWVE